MTDRKPLKQEVEELVKANGGWLNVITRFTNSFDDALTYFGKSVDCPFPSRHKNSGGKDSFRFSDKPGYEGRGICTCMPEGTGLIDLLLEDGLGGGDYIKAMQTIRNGLKGYSQVIKREAPLVVRSPRVVTEDQVAVRKVKLSSIAKGLLPLDHPDAKIGRMYFRSRGIPLNAVVGDVKFHPALEYFETIKIEGTTSKQLVGRYPAIVSAMRSSKGFLVNLHKIYLTPEGRKLDTVKKAKKIDSPLPGFTGSSIAVASIQGCRTLHVTEGVEKAWAIHLATGETVRAAYACAAIATMDIPAEYSRVVIWSDNDPFNETTGKYGAGQTFAWKLFISLIARGVEVEFLLPNVDHVPGVKGLDWEDIIVKEGVLEMPMADRLDFLRSRAEEGGLRQQSSEAA